VEIITNDDKMYVMEVKGKLGLKCLDSLRIVVLKSIGTLLTNDVREPSSSFCILNFH
jgi:hypothetical protein